MIRHGTVRWILALALMFGAAGCGGDAVGPAGGPTAGARPSADASTSDPGPPPEGQSEPEAASPADAPPLEAPPVTLTTLDWEGVEQLVAGHKGKIVVVDLWSTWCDPCRREFPHFVRLHEELRDRGVVCVSVSCDYDGIPSRPVESLRPQVLEFLQKQRATFENVMSKLATEDLFNLLKIGGVPAVFVYDRSGELVRKFTDPVDGEEFTYAGQIRPYVESLLETP